MLSDYEVSVEVDADPDRVWELVGDPASVPRWYPLYASCEIEGDRRVLRRHDGVELVERLLERDDERRFYSYAIVSGVPLRDHRASFEVRPTATGSVVVWRTRAETEDPDDDLEARLAPRQRETLERIRRLVEDG